MSYPVDLSGLPATSRRRWCLRLCEREPTEKTWIRIETSPNTFGDSGRKIKIERNPPDSERRLLGAECRGHTHFRELTTKEPPTGTLPKYGDGDPCDPGIERLSDSLRLCMVNRTVTQTLLSNLKISDTGQGRNGRGTVLKQVIKIIKL